MLQYWGNSFGFAAAASDYDTDAQDFINRVIAADVLAGNSSGLEVGVQNAINAFVVGCKADGIWSAIKTACILAGARTLAGALVPLVGPAPTNVGNAFVSSDYNRKTGLLGNSLTKNLNSNRNNSADPQNSNHNAVYVTAAGTGTNVYIGCGAATNEAGANNMGINAGTLFMRNRSSASFGSSNAGATGLIGTSRSSSTAFDYRFNGSTQQHTLTSQPPFNGNMFVFSTTNNNFRANARITFYSIGEYLILALLDARVSALLTAISAAF